MEINNERLTGNLGGVLDALIDLRINSNHHVSLDGDLLVPLLNFRLHPSHEGLTDDSGSKVDDELLVEASDLLWIIWQIPLKSDIPAELLKDRITKRTLDQNTRPYIVSPEY